MSPIQWFSYLRGLEHCSAALSDFLDLIQKHMLVINPDERWGSKKVLWRLKQILNQKSNPEEYYCSARTRVDFHPSPLLSPWDESSYDQRLLYHLNDKADLLTYSGLQSSVDLAISALPASMKHDMELFDVAFLSQSSFSVYGPSRSPTITTTGTETAPEDQSDTVSDASSPAHDPGSREVSVDITPGPCPDHPPQPLLQVDTTNLPPKLFGKTSSMSSMQVSTDCTQHDASQDAQFLCTPSKSHGPHSSKATSIFTNDMRRSMSSCTGRSTPDTNDFPEQVQSAGESCEAAPETEAIGGRVANENPRLEDGGGSGHRVEKLEKSSTPEDKSSIRRSWESLRRRFKVF